MAGYDSQFRLKNMVLIRTLCMVGYGCEDGDVLLLVHGVIRWIASVKWKKLVWYGVVCDGRNLCLLFWDVKCSSRLQ